MPEPRRHHERKSDNQTPCRPNPARPGVFIAGRATAKRDARLAYGRMAEGRDAHIARDAHVDLPARGFGAVG